MGLRGWPGSKGNGDTAGLTRGAHPGDRGGTGAGLCGEEEPAEAQGGGWGSAQGHRAAAEGLCGAGRRGRGGGAGVSEGLKEGEGAGRGRALLRPSRGLGSCSGILPSSGSPAAPLPTPHSVLERPGAGSLLGGGSARPDLGARGQCLAEQKPL